MSSRAAEQATLTRPTPPPATPSRRVAASADSNLYSERQQYNNVGLF